MKDMLIWHLWRINVTLPATHVLHALYGQLSEKLGLVDAVGMSQQTAHVYCLHYIRKIYVEKMCR